MKTIEPHDQTPKLPLPRYPGESAQAYLGYVTFYCLTDRNLQHVADAMRVHIGTVRRWSSKFKWSDRLVEQKARLLGQRAATESAIVKSETARLEEENKARLDFAERLKYYRDLHQRMLDDYVLKHADKTRLGELTSFLVTIEKLQVLHMEFLDKNQQDKSDTALDAQFEADMAKIYGAKQLLVLMPANAEEAHGSGI